MYIFYKPVLQLTFINKVTWADSKDEIVKIYEPIVIIIIMFNFLSPDLLLTFVDVLRILSIFTSPQSG